MDPCAFGQFGLAVTLDEPHIEIADGMLHDMGRVPSHGLHLLDLCFLLCRADFIHVGYVEVGLELLDLIFWLILLEVLFHHLPPRNWSTDRREKGSRIHPWAMQRLMIDATVTRPMFGSRIRWLAGLSRLRPVMMSAHVAVFMAHVYDISASTSRPLNPRSTR